MYEVLCIGAPRISPIGLERKEGENAQDAGRFLVEDAGRFLIEDVRRFLIEDVRRFLVDNATRHLVLLKNISRQRDIWCACAIMLHEIEGCREKARCC